MPRKDGSTTKKKRTYMVQYRGQLHPDKPENGHVYDVLPRPGTGAKANRDPWHARFWDLGTASAYRNWLNEKEPTP